MTRRPTGPIGKPLLAVICGVVAVALAVGAAGPAGAAEVEIEHPAHVDVGEDVSITALITEDGEAVVGGDVALSFLGHIAGESGWVVVATGTTDDQGSVTLGYSQRVADAERMRVEYFGPDGREDTEFTVEVTDGPQLYVSDAGADLPILGVWWIVAVLGIVWGLMFLAVARLMKVGRSSDLAAGSVNAVPRIVVSFVVLTAAGMFLVVLTRPESHSNLHPSTDLDRVARVVVGEEYVALGLAGPGEAHDALDGRELYVQANCSGCHGIDGRGAAVAGALAGPDFEGSRVHSLEDLLEDVRRGPRGMPSYDEELLTDDDVAEIHDYLEAIGVP